MMGTLWLRTLEFCEGCSDDTAIFLNLGSGRPVKKKAGNKKLK
jgi:hypothetical protein